MQNNSRLARSLAALVLLLSPFAGLAAKAEAPFATVGSVVIARAEYEAAVAVGARQKFYHGHAPAEALKAFRREVGEQLVERVLLLEEAKRRGLQPNEAQVRQLVAQYDKRYGNSPQWRARRDELLPVFAEQLRKRSLIEQLERAVREVAAPDERKVRAYYDKHKDLFTEPERLHLSLIVLSVDPSSPAVAWDQAKEEAQRLREELARGADFAETARMRSADRSAADGGDLGYVHRGMLPQPIQAGVVDALQPGELSQAVRLLEGYALVRLEDRKAARLRPFEEVRSRAAALERRERGETAWKALAVTLRSGVRIRVDESAYDAPPAK